MTDDALIRRIVEAALFAASQPLSLAQLAALFPEDAPPPADSIERALAALADESASRGVELVEVASGFRFQIRDEVQPWVARLWAERQTRYSRALLETLALIAYRQPITRGEIEQIRGVAVSTSIVKTLEEREWVRVVGHRDVPGKPALYGTTRSFLDYFGLKSLDQLPPLTELHEIPELEPQLQLEPVQIAAPPARLGEDAAPSEPSEPIALGAAIAAGFGADDDDDDHDDNDDDAIDDPADDGERLQRDADARQVDDDTAAELGDGVGDDDEAQEIDAQQIDGDRAIDEVRADSDGDSADEATPEVAGEFADDDESPDDDAEKAPSEQTYE